MVKLNMMEILGKEEKGQILIEAMIAIGIIIFGILGVLALLSQGLSLNRVVADQFTATYLAAEGIEVVKNLIDANILQGRAWNQGFINDRCYEVDYTTTDIDIGRKPDCLPQSGSPIKFNALTGKYGYDAGSATPFIRTIHVVPVGSDQVQINSLVSWITRGGGSFTVDLEDHFYNWRP